MKVSTRWAVVIVPVLAVITGCGSEQLPNRQTITGTVTLESEPIQKGSIHFSSPQDIAEGTETFVDIIDGQYTAQVTLGKKRVSIRGLKETRSGGDAMPPDYVEIVPEKYNVRSELEANITKEAERFDFELQGSNS